MGPFDTAWLASVILLSTPLVLAATGELMSERGGVLNIGLEGMMLSGAFFSFLGTYLWHNVALGVVTGMVAGIVVALLMSLLCIRLRSDQIVVGVGLNLLALGVTTFTFREIFSAQNEVHLAYPAPVAIPLLSKLPVLGPTIFRQTLLGYFAFLSVGVAWFVLYRTSFGLAIRAAGEVPAAADTAGVSVNGIRTVGACIAGALGGAAGAYLSVGRLGLFNEGMTGGRGFLALAAVIFGGWNPIGVMAAALVFGAADALQLRLQSYAAIPRQVWLAIALIAAAYLVWDRVGGRDRRVSVVGSGIAVGALVTGVALFLVEPHWQFPPQLWLTLPYVFALLALAGVVGRARMPSALTTVYRRGEST
jgi:simple sugar transport system permease protein